MKSEEIDIDEHDRFVEGPLAEQMLTGMAFGSALLGMRPVLIHHRIDFTPLTLDMMRYNGIRWDMASANNRFTVLVTRLSDPIKLDLKNQLGPGGQLLGPGLDLGG